jgi:predicted DNA-binding protein
MHIRYIVKRTQIYLDESQDRRLTAKAAPSGRTKSMLIRQAIERSLETADDEAIRLARYRAAVGAAAGAVPYLARGADYVDSIRRGDEARRQELEARRR